MDPPLSPSPSFTAEQLAREPDQDEVVLEGAMLKRGRNKQWKERYFVFTAGQRLSYFHKKGDSKPRASFKVTREAGCEISDLYVDERSKGSNRDTLYCFTIHWPDSMANTMVDESFMSPDDISGAALSVPNNGHGGEDLTPYKSSNRRTSVSKFLKSPMRLHKRSVSAPINSDDGGSRSRLSRKKRFGRSKDVNGGDMSADSSLASENTGNGAFQRDNLDAADLMDKFADLDEDSTAAKEKSRKLWRSTKSPAVHKRRHTSDVIGMEIKSPPITSTYETIHEAEHEHNNDTTTSAMNTSIPNGSNHHENGTALPRSSSPPRQRPSVRSDKITAEQDELQEKYRSNKIQKQKESRKKMVEGTKVAAAAGAAIGVGVLTAGVGLAAGLVFLGATAAAGGTAGVAEAGFKRKWFRRTNISLASTSYEEAKRWKSSLEACLEVATIKESTWGQMFMADGRRSTSALMPLDLTKCVSRDGSIGGTSEDEPATNKGGTNLFLKDRNFFAEASSRWRPLEGGWTSFLGPGAQGRRILKEDKSLDNSASAKRTNLSVAGTTCPPLKVQLVLSANPLDAFMCLMSYARLPQDVPIENLSPSSGQRSSFRVLERIDDNMDVVHVVCRELYLFPSWTAPRDFVLFRYWRFEPDDGSYIVCYESVEHASCPPQAPYVRGEMHQVCTIAPAKGAHETRRRRTSAGGECLLTAVVQVDPRGWVPSKPISILSHQAYADAFGISALIQLLDIRDAIDMDRFLNVAPEINSPSPVLAKNPESSPSQDVGDGVAPEDGLAAYDFRFSGRERADSMSFAGLTGIESHPKPLDQEKWAEPDANSFLVRGPLYKIDRVKVNAGRSIGQLIAVDVVRVDSPIYSGMATHPTERIQMALKREKRLLASGQKSDMPPFIFVVVSTETLH